MGVHLDIDLRFSVTSPADDSGPASTIQGTVTADGTEVAVHVDDPSIFQPGSGVGWAGLRDFARELHERGLSLSLASPEGILLSLGDVKANAAQRVLTRSAHIRPGSVGAFTAWARARGSGATGSPMPPGTPFPLSPTFGRNYRMRPTTTHYAAGGGRPRLVFVRDAEAWDGRPAEVFELRTESSVIGSAHDADLTLPGILESHAVITHTADDEYVLTAEGAVTGSTGLADESPYILRTGARIGIGPWRLVFVREEYADHGRPYGGRQGGELAYQRPQYDPRRGTVEQDASYGLGNFRDE